MGKVKTIKTLYQKAKTGKIHFWKAWTNGGEVVVEHGTIDGKAVINRYDAEPTNVGRSNERNAEQQAQFEVDSLYKKKLDKKYCTTIKEANKGKFLPMTAHDTKVETKKAKITYPCYVQRKYNGLRCMSNWRPVEKDSVLNQVYLMSRGNKEYIVNHIELQLKKILGKKDAFDGELYKHGMPLQQINSLVKKWRQGESEVINYVVYDYPIINGKSLTQKVRIDKLKSLKKLCKGTNIIIADVYVANNWEEIVAYEKQFIAEGYEGAIVRTYEGEYEFGNRSDSLLKIKTFQDAEFEVVNFDVEKSDINGKKIDAVVWICKNDMKSTDGSIKTFEVRPKGTFESRAEMLKNVQDYIGKKLTVKFFDRTPDNIPFHGVGMLFRLDEDLPDES